MNLKTIPLISTGISKRKGQKVIGSHCPNLNRFAKGGHGIRQYFRIDETKLTAEKHLGKNLDANEYSQ